MIFAGGGLAVPGGMINLKGLSGTALAAQNLRGINVKVAAGSQEFTVTFAKPAPDANYAIFIEPSWLTGHAVTSQTADGFTITFETPSPKGATLHWLLVR